MKFWRTLGAVVSILSVVFTAAAAISYLVSRSSCNSSAPAGDDYIDCGIE